MYWLVYRLEYDRLLAGTSVVILVTSLQFWVVSKVVITDVWLFLFHSMAVGWMYLALHTKKKAFALSAYIAAGLAVLTKGPVGALLPAGTLWLYLIWRKQWKWKEYSSRLCCRDGSILFFFMVFPWYGYMYAVHGEAFVNGFIGLHNVTRAVVSEHPDMNAAYYYLVAVPVALLPWTGVFFKAMGSLVFRKQRRTTLLYFYWMLLPVVFYSCVATKYPTYAFVALFPAAIVTAKEFLRLLQSGTKVDRFWMTVPMAIYFMVLGIGTMKLQLAGAESFIFF